MFFLLAVFVPCLVIGQQAAQFPQLQPAAVTVYDIDRGLPISCMDDVYIGPKGQLWINPCRNQDIYQNLSFFAYDGEKSNIISLEAPGVKAGSRGWYLNGQSEGGMLFGADSSNTLGFLFDPNSREHWIYSFPAAENIRNMIPGTGRQAYVLTQSREAYHIYRLAPGEGKKLLVSIPVAMDARPYFREKVPAQRFGDTLWFLCENKGFARYSLTDNSLKQYDWRDVLDSDFRGYPPYSEGWTNLVMTVDHRGWLLFYIRFFGFFVFDPASGQLSRQTQLDTFIKQISFPSVCGISFVKDLQENILVTLSSCQPPGGKTATELTAYALLDRDGVVFDYSPVGWMAGAGRHKPGGGTFYAKHDFKKNILIANPGGLIAIDVKPNLSISTFVKDMPLRAMGELEHGRVLALSETGFKSIINLSTGELLRVDPNSDGPFAKAQIYSQLISSGDDLWFSNGDGRLGCYQRQTGTFRYYTVGQVFDKFNFISKTEIALVSTQNEVCRYDLDRKKLSPVLQNGKPLQIGGTVNEVYTGKNGMLWIATLNGLWRIDPKTGKSTRLGKADGFADDRFFCINESEDGKLWLGTMDAGIIIYDPATGGTETIDQSSGLSNNTVVGILTDVQGDRWVSTFNGITVLTATGQVQFDLSEEEGLSHREFNRYSYLKTSDGRMLFGGISGANLLNPEEIKSVFTQNVPLRIYLTGIDYYDKNKQNDIHLSEQFDQLKEIYIPATHRYIKIDFGLSDYNRPDKCAFAYRLERDGSTSNGMDQDALWTNIGSSSELILNDLPVGEYSILIRGLNSKGQWTEKPLSVSVSVQEFFYKTWWFYLLCFMAFAGAALYWMYRQRILRKNLENELAERTSEIMDTRDQLIAQEKLASLGQMVAGIAHEIKNPLNFINNFSEGSSELSDELREELLQYQSDPSEARFQTILAILDDLKQNADDVLEYGTQADRIVRSMMDHARGTSGSRQPVDINKLVDENINLAYHGFRATTPSFQAHIEKDLEPGLEPVNVFQQEIGRVFINILTNACFAIHEKQKVSGNDYQPAIRVSTGVQDGMVFIRIWDNGPGIPEAIRKDIFLPFFTTKPAGEGNTGLGLSISYDIIVQQHKGKLEVNSEPGVFTEFVIQLPKA